MRRPISDSLRETDLADRIDDASNGGAPLDHSARDGFQSSANFATWAQDLNKRRSEVPINSFYRDGKYYPDYFKLPDEEWKPLEKIYGQVKTFEANVGMLEGIFKDVEGQARTLMGALNRGGGSAAY